MFAAVLQKLARLRGAAPVGASTANFLRRGSGVSLLLKIMATGFSFATGVFLARVLGPESYGTYAYLMAVITLLAMPAALGAPQLLVRQIAAFQYHQDWGSMLGIMRWSNRVVGLTALALVLAAAAAAWLITYNLPPTGFWALWLALPMVPLLALGSLRVAALQGLHHVVLAQLPEGLLRPGLFLAGAAVVYWFLGTHFDAFSAMAVQLGATAIAFVAGAWMLRRLRPPQMAAAQARQSPARWRASMLPLLFISGVYVINTNADLLMLGWLSTADDVGVYRVATRGAQVVLFVLMAANLTAAPVFSRLYQEQREQLQHAVTLTARMILVFAVPVALFLILFGEPVLNLLFGSAYVGATAALAILSAGQLVNAGSGSAAELLMMTGHERANARVAAVGLVANVGLNALLIPVWGINGAAAATASSTALVNIMLAVSVRRRLRIDTTALGIAPAADPHAGQ